MTMKGFLLCEFYTSLLPHLSLSIYNPNTWAGEEFKVTVANILSLKSPELHKTLPKQTNNDHKALSEPDGHMNSGLSSQLLRDAEDRRSQT